MLTVRGYAKKELYSKGDFKIYSFCPVGESREMMVLDPKYNSASINGVLPTLSPDIEYTFDVEYSQSGKYHNYKVVKIHNNFMKSDIETNLKLLSAFTSEGRAKTLVDAYPNIIQMIVDNKPIDVSKLKNIGERTLESIKEKVIKNYQLLGVVDEYADYGMTFNMMKKLFDHYKSVDMIKQKMESDPYTCLCKINRVGFKVADGFIMAKFPHKIDSKERGLAAMQYLLRENEESGHTWIAVQELLVKYTEFVPECKKHFVDIIKENEDTISYDKENKRVYMLNTLICEREAAKLIRELINSKVTPLKVDYSKYRHVGGFDLSDEQFGLLDMVNNNGIAILAGVGGSGKSFSMRALTKMMRDCGMSILPLSSTGSLFCSAIQ